MNLFNYKVEINPKKKELIESAKFINLDSSWYGNESLDDRVEKLLPNHYLDIKEKQTGRIPFFSNTFSDEIQIIKYTSSILRGTYASLVQRYQLRQPLTAGWDTRILLAASKSIRKKVQYYVFNNFDEMHADVRIPLSLSQKLGFNFKIIKPVSIRDDFLEKYKQEHILPRIVPKTAHIQHHFDCGYHQNTINISGNAAEIARCFYGYTGRKITTDMLLTFSGYKKDIPYINEQIEKWYPDAYQFAEIHGIPLLDLFYWEQRMGNWGALFPFEQDIAIDELSPFNNKDLLYSFLQVKPSRRKSPNYPFYHRLLNYLWPEVLTEPINPEEKFLQKIKKGNSMVRYYASKIKTALSK